MASSFEIGVVMDFPSTEIVDGVRSYCDEHSIWVDARWSIRGDWVISDPDWNGVIYKIADLRDTRLVERVSSWDMQKVSLMESHEPLSVVEDHYQMGVLAAEELIRCGQRKLWCVLLSDSPVDMKFTQGCADQMLRHGGEVRMIHYKDMPHVEGMSSYARYIATKASAERSKFGLCLAHAGMAMTLEKCLLEKNIKIPDDVSIVVMDKDIQNTAALCPVPLTAVKPDFWMQGYVAAEMLHKKLMGKEVERNRVFIPPKGINKRESTGHLSESDPVMARALGYIRANYTRQIGVVDVVDAVGASRRVVEMRFREVLDRGVGEEINRLRMEHAKRLLKEGKLKVAEIADHAGFSSLHYFSAAFKRATGMSPRIYQSQSLLLDS